MIIIEKRCRSIVFVAAKGVTAAKVRGRKYIRNRGYGGSVRTSAQAAVKSILEAPTEAVVTLTPTKFTFELESEPENIQDLKLIIHINYVSR